MSQLTFRNRTSRGRGLPPPPPGPRPPSSLPFSLSTLNLLTQHNPASTRNSGRAARPPPRAAHRGRRRPGCIADDYRKTHSPTLRPSPAAAVVVGVGAGVFPPAPRAAAGSAASPSPVLYLPPPTPSLGGGGAEPPRPAAADTDPRTLPRASPPLGMKFRFCLPRFPCQVPPEARTERRPVTIPPPPRPPSPSSLRRCSCLSLWRREVPGFKRSLALAGLPPPPLGLGSLVF